MAITFLKGLGSPTVPYLIQATKLVADARANNKKASSVLEAFLAANPLDSVGSIDLLKDYARALLVCVGFAVTTRELTVDQLQGFGARLGLASMSTDLAAERTKLGQVIDELEILLGIRWSTTKRLVIGVGVLSVIGGGIYLYTRKK